MPELWFYKKGFGKGGQQTGLHGPHLTQGLREQSSRFSFFRQRNRTAMASQSGTPQASLFYGNPFNVLALLNSSHLLFEPQILESPLLSPTPHSVCQDKSGLPSGYTENPLHCCPQVQAAIPRHRLLSALSAHSLSKHSPLPVPTVCSQHSSQRDFFFFFKSKWVTPFLKSCQWLPFSLRLKPQVLPMTHKALHDPVALPCCWVPCGTHSVRSR